MPLLADRVLESSITAGTGTLTLAGALTGYRTFNSAFSNGNVVYYTIDDGLGNWEVGYGTVGTGTLTRSTVLESSNANALVVFTSVSKRVFCTAPVPALLPDQTGNSTKVLSTDGTNPSWIANTVSLTTQVSGTLPVLNGGTGVTTSTGTGSVVLSASPTFTGATTISVTDNTNAALRITQTGTGNALVVEDSTNPDSTPFMIDASGNVGIGVLPAFANNKLSIAGSGVDAQSWLVRYSADANGYDIRLLKTRSTNIYAQSVVQSGDLLGALSFGGDDGSVYRLAASISAAVDGTPGTNDMPGRLVFSTTADGASSPTERMRIDSSGNVGIGTSSPAQKLSVAGTIESTTGGVKFPDGTTQTTAATAGITTGKAIAMAMIFGG